MSIVCINSIVNFHQCPRICRKMLNGNKTKFCDGAFNISFGFFPRVEKLLIKSKSFHIRICYLRKWVLYDCVMIGALLLVEENSYTEEKLKNIFKPAIAIVSFRI